MSPLAFWLARRHRHARPHFECMNPHEHRCENGTSDEPGFRHTCSCSCKRCSITMTITTAASSHEIEVCICPDCDARECGLHTAPGALRAHR